MKLSTGSTVDWLNGPYDEACTIYAAIYNADGKLLDVQTGDRSSNQSLVSLTFDLADPPEGSCVKAFLLGGNHQPLTNHLQ